MIAALQVSLLDILIVLAIVALILYIARRLL